MDRSAKKRLGAKRSFSWLALLATATAIAWSQPTSATVSPNISIGGSFETAPAGPDGIFILTIEARHFAIPTARVVPHALGDIEVLPVEASVTLPVEQVVRMPISLKMVGGREAGTLIVKVVSPAGKELGAEVFEFGRTPGNVLKQVTAKEFEASSKAVPAGPPLTQQRRPRGERWMQRSRPRRGPYPPQLATSQLLNSRPLARSSRTAPRSWRGIGSPAWNPWAR